MKHFLAFLAALAAFVFISCILGGEKVAGKRGSEVENELGVYGVLVGEDGKPVKGAKVVALPSARVATAGDTDTVTTDFKGRYAFDSLASGEYNILGDFQSGALVVLIPEVRVVQTNNSLDIGTDTLRAPGSIRGRMLVGLNGKGGVLCVIPGLSRLDLSDDSGRFELTGLPQGRYSVRYSATGFVIAPDSGVEVVSGRPTVLPDKQLEYDPALNPPEPVGLKAVYDTLNQRVLLMWEAVPVSDLDGFVIYRDDPAFLNPEIVKGGFTKNVFFTDSAFESALELEGRDLVYRVKARDKGLNLSLNFSGPAEVRAVSRNLVTTTSEVEVTGLRMGEGSPGDSIRLILRFSNPGRTIREIGWFLAGTAGPVRLVPGTSGSGSDTLLWRTGEAGTEDFTVRMTDDAGRVWSAARLIQVVEDSPVSIAGRDREVSFNDSLRLHGEGSDRFGRIVKWEWSIGGGLFTDSPGGSFSFHAPSAQGKIACRLRVTDDDGKQGEDTLLINVVEDRPVVSAGRDTLVSINDRVDLRPTASDGYGSIVSWEWKIGGAGVFTAFPSGETSFTALSVPGALDCILRVTDDDGQTDLDTVLVTVLQDPPVAHAGNDTLVTPFDGIRLRGSGYDGMGRIVKWEWDAGATGHFAASGPDTLVYAPKNPISFFPCVLRVTDDDGNAALDTMNVKIVGDAPHAEAGMDTVVSIGDAIHLHGTGSDGTGTLDGWFWKCGSEEFVKGDAYSVRFAPSSPDTRYPCVLMVEDNDGQTSYDTAWVSVLVDSPNADAGADTILSILDRVELRGKGTDGFGRIVKWEWDIGATGVFTSGGKDTAFNAPAGVGEIPCVLRIIDDDGQTASDVIIVKVVLDPPEALITTAMSLSGFVDDPLQLTGNQSKDFFGTVVKWEWDIGGDGVFVNTMGPVFVGALPSVPQKGMPCILRVTDDDGNTGLDTIQLDVLDKGGRAWAKSSGIVPFPGRYGQASVVFQGRIWAIAGTDTQVRNDVWSSLDGETWTLATASAAFSPRDFPTCVVFKDRLWLIGGRLADGRYLSDVWSSADGVNWERATDAAGFEPYYLMRSCVFNGKIWVLWGEDFPNGPKEYLWSSVDGIHWVPEAGPISQPRISKQFLLSRDGLMWTRGSDFTLYVTSDGKTWSQPGWDPTFPDILFPAAMDLKGTLLVTGANAVSGAMEIWRIPMAGPPLLVAEKVPFEIWDFPTSTVFKDKMWLMKKDNGANSIWYSE